MARPALPPPPAVVSLLFLTSVLLRGGATGQEDYQLLREQLVEHKEQPMKALEPWFRRGGAPPLLDPTSADLLARLLAFDPSERLSAAEALRHPYFAASG